MPGYLSYVTGLSGAELASDRQRGRMLAGAALFVLGFTVVFTAEGTLFGSLGNQLGAHRRAVTECVLVAVSPMGMVGVVFFFLIL